MMKVYIYQNGGVVLRDPDDPDHATIGGEEPVTELDATPEVIKFYFGDPQPSNVKTS